MQRSLAVCQSIVSGAIELRLAAQRAARFAHPRRAVVRLGAGQRTPRGGRLSEGRPARTAEGGVFGRAGEIFFFCFSIGVSGMLR